MPGGGRKQRQDLSPVAPDGNGMLSRQEGFGVRGWWEELLLLGALGLHHCRGREKENRSLEAGRNPSWFSALFRNKNTPNSLRTGLLSRWYFGPFGKFSISAAGNPSWESDPRGLWSCSPRSLGSLGNSELCPVVNLGDEPSSDLAPSECH